MGKDGLVEISLGQSIQRLGYLQRGLFILEWVFWIFLNSHPEARCRLRAWSLRNLAGSFTH